MMDRKQALEALLAKVEGGVDTAHHHAAAFPSESAYGKCTWHDSHKAYHGSLDAAKALHDAVLPGWLVEIEIDDDGVWDVCIPWKADPEQCNSEWAQGDNPARAWLCAILKALIAREGV